MTASNEAPEVTREARAAITNPSNTAITTILTTTTNRSLDVLFKNGNAKCKDLSDPDIWIQAQASICHQVITGYCFTKH